MHLVKRGCCWQWAIGGLGSGTRIQSFWKWFKDKFLGLFHYFLSTAFFDQQGENFFFSPPWPIDNK